MHPSITDCKMFQSLMHIKKKKFKSKGAEMYFSPISYFIKQLLAGKLFCSSFSFCFSRPSPLTVLLQSLERKWTFRTMLVGCFPLKTWNMDQMPLSAVTTPWRPFNLAGRQVQKCQCSKWQTQEPLIRGLVCFLGGQYSQGVLC